MRSERAGAVNRASKRPRKRPQPAPARVGASCERCPRIRPSLVVDPTRAGAAFWACVRVSKRLSPRALEGGFAVAFGNLPSASLRRISPKAIVREKSPSCPTWALAFGAGRVLRWLLVRASRLTRSSADFPRRRGRRGRLTPSKSERGTFRPSKLAENRRARFSASGGRRPLFNERDTAAHDLPANCRGVRLARASPILA